MTRHQPNRNPSAPPPPLDGGGLERLALHYVERYATTRARLAAYLRRKLRERGAADGVDPELAVDGIVARIAALGYVDDRAFAEMRGASLARRGYGARRRQDALRAAGVTAADMGAAETTNDDAGGWASALVFARRRRIGPYADAMADPDRRRRQLAAMLRAGHDFPIARTLVEAMPGAMPPQADEGGAAGSEGWHGHDNVPE